MKQKKAKITEYELLDLAKKVVSRYGHAIPTAEREDVVMSLVETYLKQEEKIWANFNGNSKVTTYIIAILNRMCCGVIRKELKHWQMADESHFAYLHQRDDGNAAVLRTMIDDEINYLKKILILFDDNAKTIVFLAFYYLLKAKLFFVSQYDTSGTSQRTLAMLNTEEKRNKGDIFEALSFVVKQVEKRTIKADAVRMWLNKQQNTILVRLNGPFGRAHYDKDSFRVLFEYFYEKE